MPSPVSIAGDFPDRISPMLVKELRQGLRAKTFIVVFLSLQIALGVMLLAATAASGSNNAGSLISGIIFAFFSIAVIVIQPLRGVTALSSEVKGNTIDMMVLTRLSAWRIVFGKWVAIVSQSALLLATIIPYLILRYFLGGMNLFAEMVLLALLFVTSMALTAITVGLSGSSSVIIRGLIPIFGSPFLIFSLLGLAFGGGTHELIELCSLDTPASQIAVSAYLCSLAYLGGSALSLGASFIAPSADNHSTRRRLIAIGLMLAGIPLLNSPRIDDWVVPIVLSIIIVPAVVIALTESAPLVPSVCAPFVKRGVLGKLAGMFLLPGWASGALFTVLMLCLGMVAVFFRQQTHVMDPEYHIVFLSLTGWLLLPAVIQAATFKGEGQRFAHYVLLFLASGILTGSLAAMSEAMNTTSFLWFFVWNPLVFTILLDDHTRDNSQLLNAVIAVNFILIAGLLIFAFISLSRSRGVLHEAEANPDPETP